MRDIVLATASSVALLVAAYGPAKAADKAGPPPIQEPAHVASMAPSCYVGATAGAAVHSVKAEGAYLPAALSASGWTVGASVGCDVKMERVVVGALARVELPVDTDGNFIKADTSWLGAVRVGYLFGPGVMGYALAGYTQSDWKIDVEKLSKNGIVLGGGLEVFLSKHVSLIAEYTQTAMDKTDLGYGVTIKPVDHTARVGLNYRFNSLFGE